PILTGGVWRPVIGIAEMCPGIAVLLIGLTYEIGFQSMLGEPDNMIGRRNCRELIATVAHLTCRAGVKRRWIWIGRRSVDAIFRNREDDQLRAFCVRWQAEQLAEP